MLLNNDIYVILKCRNFPEKYSNAQRVFQQFEHSAKSVRCSTSTSQTIVLVHTEVC